MQHLSITVAALCAIPAAAFAEPAVVGGSLLNGLSLVPHRAVYDVSLGQSKSGRVRLESAGGRLVYEFTGNACDGFSTSLRFVTQMKPQESSGNAEATVTDVRSSTHESGDGNEMRFLTATYSNNKLRETADGTARRGKEGALTVVITRPKDKKLDLPANIIFPTFHLAGIVQSARTGEKFYGIDLYDGGEGGEKVFGTMTVIGPAAALPLPGDHPVARSALKDARRWPITISFFSKGDQGESLPLYELSTELMENGISATIHLDYGDFALQGKMKALEVLPSTPCKN